MPGKTMRESVARRACELWLGLALAMALTGCELLQQVMPETPPPPATSSVPPDTETVPAVVAVTPPPAKPKPLVAAPSTKPSIEPQALVGLSEEEITRLLGKPRDVRNDPPAMVWNYAAGECRLNLFFYLDLKSQDFRALSYNFDPPTAADGVKKACLEKLQEANDRNR